MNGWKRLLRRNGRLCYVCRVKDGSRTWKGVAVCSECYVLLRFRR